MTRNRRLRRTLASLLHNDRQRVSVRALFCSFPLSLPPSFVYHNPWHRPLSLSNYFRHRETGARTSDRLFVNRIVCQQPSSHYACYAFAKHVARARSFNPRPGCFTLLFAFSSYLLHSSSLLLSLAIRNCVRKKKRDTHEVERLSVTRHGADAQTAIINQNGTRYRENKARYCVMVDNNLLRDVNELAH